MRICALAAATKDDLGVDGIGPGCRPLGRADHPQPLIGWDGKVRTGFEFEWFADLDNNAKAR